MKINSYRCIIHSLKSICFIFCQKHGNKVLHDYLQMCFYFTISCDAFINEFLQISLISVKLFAAVTLM